MDIYAERYLASLAQPLYDNFQRIETDAIKKICNHIREIGDLTITDIYTLNKLQRVGYDVYEIEKEIVEALRLSKVQAYNIFYDSSKLQYDSRRKIFEQLGKAWITFESNKIAQELVESIATITYNDFRNYARSTGFVNALGEWSPLSEYYQNVVDYAILQVRLGQKDFHSVMRQAIRAMADSGLSYGTNKDGTMIVNYPSRYKRRLDSSIRNAFMGGQSRLSRELALMQGKLFGADGMEVSWHGGARPSHQDFAGKQYDMSSYQRICVPLLNEANCYHRSFPIVLGISEPLYTTDDLKTKHDAENEPREYNGKQYTLYESTQRQRQLETAIRRQKDRITAFNSAGDTEQARLEKAKLNQYNAEYKSFSAAMDLRTQPARARVTGYGRKAG